VSGKDRERAEQVADKLSTSLSAAYRQAMNRFHEELFRLRSPKKPTDS
jgi:hypothetical protein